MLNSMFYVSFIFSYHTLYKRRVTEEYYFNFRRKDNLPKWWVSSDDPHYINIDFAYVSYLIYMATSLLIPNGPFGIILFYITIALSVGCILHTISFYIKETQRNHCFCFNKMDIFASLLIISPASFNIRQFLFPGGISFLGSLACYAVTIVSVVLAIIIIHKIIEGVCSLFKHMANSDPYPVFRPNVTPGLFGGGMSSKEIHHETKHTLPGIREGSGQQATFSAKYRFGKLTTSPESS